MNSKSDVYVYIYLNPFKKGVFKYGNYTFYEEPFYVGIGVKRRCYYHLCNFSNSHKSNTIKQIKKMGNVPTILKIKENLTRKSAELLEKKIIKLIGRWHLNKGPLTNLTEGGGHSDTSKFRVYETGEAVSKRMKKIRKLRINKPQSEETKKKISLSHKGVKKSKQHREALSKAWIKRKKKGLYIKKHSEATKKKIGIANKGRPNKYKGKKISKSIRLRISKTKRKKFKELQKKRGY